MKLHPRVTKAAVELVERFEGLRRRAARLPDGRWTIGYGHTLSAREGAVVSPEDAEALLYYDLSEVATKVEAWTFTPLNQNQFEALTAFAFNIGVENFRHSTVLKRVNEGQHLQAAAAMELWRKTEVDGEALVVDALVRRRAAEKAHYLTPPEGFRPSPTQVLKPAFDFSVIEAASHSQLAQRATVIDAPLEGDVTSATVETPPAGPATPPEVGAPLHPASDAQETPQDGGAEDLAAPVLAEAIATPTMHAPADPEPPAPEPSGNEPSGNEPSGNEPSGSEGAASLEDRPFPLSTPVFRSFEPPPSRFGRRTEEPPAPADEPQGVAQAPVEAAPTAEVAPSAVPAVASDATEATPEFNLFNRPLAPPAPSPVRATAATPAFPTRTARLRDDTYEDVPAEARPRSPRSSGVEQTGAGLAAAWQNRTVIWGAVGCIGVLFFALAITSMMMGPATLTHLLIGFLGVVLITPAGVYFLLRRSAEGHAEPEIPEDPAPVEATDTEVSQ